MSSMTLPAFFAEHGETVTGTAAHPNTWQTHVVTGKVVYVDRSTIGVLDDTGTEWVMHRSAIKSRQK
jgi:hypothetical protein